MASKALRAVYKQLLRQSKQLEGKGIPQLEVRLPLDREAWPYNGGQHGWEPPYAEFHREALRKLLPWLAVETRRGSFTPAELLACVRQQFRSPAAASLDPGQQLDRAFEALRVLGEQLHLAECSSSAQTEGIHVEVTTAYVGPQSDLDPTYEPEEGVAMKHFFTYRIRISNVGQELVQLLGRHWQILDEAGNTVTEVPRGSKGIVGCTPLLRPNECFSYYSGTDLEGRAGSMQGSFQMVQLDSQHRILRGFDATVAPFRFIT